MIGIIEIIWEITNNLGRKRSVIMEIQELRELKQFVLDKFRNKELLSESEVE